MRRDISELRSPGMPLHVVELGPEGSIVRQSDGTLDDHCWSCWHSFDPADRTPAGRAQFGDYSFCRKCISTCVILLHRSGGSHRCLICDRGNPLQHNEIMELAGKQIPELMMTLRDVLNEAGDVRGAMAVAELHQPWIDALSEARAAVLLSLAWHAKPAEPISPGGGQAETYAANLQTMAQLFTGDVDSFHGPRFPLPPLPGQAGALASSLAFDREDLEISLETALLLMAAGDTAGPLQDTATASSPV